MNVYAKDAEIGDIKLSHYHLILAEFDSGGIKEEDLGSSYQTEEIFIGNSSIPKYLGAHYTDKLSINMTLIRNPDCENYGSGEIPMEDCRAILRNLTGRKFYQKLVLYQQDYDEPIHFNVRCVSSSYQKLDDRIIGITLEFECDSQYAWTEERIQTVHFKKGQEYVVMNLSDNLDEYVLPKVQIVMPANTQELKLTNLTDNNRETILTNLSRGETILMDSQKSLLYSSEQSKNILNGFNFVFIKLRNGVNRYRANCDVDISFSFSEARKVGVR